MTTPPPYLAPIIEGDSTASPVILVCEHASNTFPAPWGTLGLTPEQQQAHIAWDIGALGLARGLAQRMNATLVHAPVSRLIYDLNRAPHQPGAMPARSEVHDVPGNQTLTPQDRAARMDAVYLPFHHGLHGVLMQRLAVGVVPVVITIHSFTPVYFGAKRTVEFGVIHDADPALATAIVTEARARTHLRCALNEPYSAADDVTHTLRLHATPYALPNAMLEVRNDLITTSSQQDSMAEMLAPVLLAALPKGAA